MVARYIVLGVEALLQTRFNIALHEVDEEDLQGSSYMTQAFYFFVLVSGVCLQLSSRGRT